ncbi:uncharacterized protein LOC134726420 [Mytilus trossulus]|uniref:uncharacterized protein LOC134726420 n=1 Tax=Mytilus trossulus TaxID=6551 RepID=UPI003007DECB
MELQRTELKKEVDKHIDKLKSETMKGWRDLHQSIKKEESEVTLLIKSMKSKHSEVEEIIQSENAERVFVDGLESVNLMEEAVISPCTMFDSIPKFLSGQISATNIGTLENVSAKDDLKSIKQFQTEMSCVSLMTACSDNVLWISGRNKLQKAKIEGTSLKITDQKDIEIYGMALTQSKDLLLIAKESSVVQLINNQTGEMTDSVYEIEDLELSAIHVNPDGKVTFGAYNGEMSFPTEGRRVVIVMDRSGKFETTYEYDRQGKPLFTLITGITRTNNSNICVVDTISNDWVGRLVILSEDGDVLNTFSGLSNEMSDSESKFDSERSDSESDTDPDTESDSDPSSFKPMCVITTQSDNIIVSNLDNGFLLFLNNSGNVLSLYDTNKIGIDNPISFCMTSEHMYIGCFTNEDSSDNAKIYEVDIL